MRPTHHAAPCGRMGNNARCRGASRERARTAVEFIWAAYSAHTHDRRAIPSIEDDADLAWVSERAAAAKLPRGWEVQRGADGRLRYVEAGRGRCSLGGVPSALIHASTSRA